MGVNSVILNELTLFGIFCFSGEEKNILNIDYWQFISERGCK